MRLISNHSSRGFSLVELLLVLAIVAALAVAAFLVYPRVRAAQIAEDEAKMLTAAQASIRALFPLNRYNSLTATVALDSGAIPAHLAKGDGTIENRWGGYILVTHAQDDGQMSTVTGPRRYFRFLYSQVPTDVCIRLVGAASKNFGLIRVSHTGVGYSYWDTVQNLYAAEPKELDEELTAKACKGTDGKAAITFVSN